MTTQMVRGKREGDVARVESARDRRTYLPNVDILETREEFLILADMPGVTPDHIEIEYEQGVLTIHGQVDPRQDEATTHYLLREYGIGDFHRSFTIGQGVDADRIEAHFKDGVMELHLPKSEAVKPRRITVKGG